jgi:DNA-directed RNA polymerase specialized sigma24 family protein
MQSDVPTPPQLLERATRGEPAALSALVCARKERAYLLAVALSGGGFETELSSDVTASMDELADVCAHAHDTSPPARDYDPGRSGTVRVDEMRESTGARGTLTQQALLRRWQIVHNLCRALTAVADEQRALLVLVDIEGLESDQVAWLLGLSEAETCQRLFTARALLRARLLSPASTRKSA